jgi:hypothetical protein
VHTEHLQNVHLGWVAAGWLVALAVTSLLLLALAALGIAAPDDSVPAVWTIAAVAVGFFAGGLFAGFRSIDAPILHGVAIGIFSLVAWFVVNLAATLVFPGATWQSLSPALAAGVLVLQLALAVAGAHTGHRIALSGGPEPAE